MAQPVRKNIGDKYITDHIYTMLIDGNALLKVSMKDPKLNTRGEHVGGIFQFLLQLRKLIVQRNWDYVYVFFDDEDSGILRYELYKPYKANRDKKYGQHSQLSDYMKTYNETLKNMQNAIFNKSYEKKVENNEDVSEDDANFARERLRLMSYFEELYIRCYMDPKTEADDLIAYYVQNRKLNEKIVIATTDMDISQLICEDVYVYNLRLKKAVTHLNFRREFGYHYENICLKKIFCGDVSDNISNIKGLSENKFFELMPEVKDRPVTIQEVKDRAQQLIDERKAIKKKPFEVHKNIVNGIANKEYDGDYYEINEKIINLKKPLLTDEAKEAMDSMMYAPQDPEGRSFKNIYEMIVEDDITDLLGDNQFSGFFSVFKPLEQKEQKRFKEML